MNGSAFFSRPKPSGFRGHSPVISRILFLKVYLLNQQLYLVCVIFVIRFISIILSTYLITIKLFTFDWGYQGYVKVWVFPIFLSGFYWETNNLFIYNVKINFLFLRLWGADFVSTLPGFDYCIRATELEYWEVVYFDAISEKINLKRIFQRHLEEINLKQIFLYHFVYKLCRFPFIFGNILV